jgi:hypothetical protein
MKLKRTASQDRTGDSQLISRPAKICQKLLPHFSGNTGGNSVNPFNTQKRKAVLRAIQKVKATSYIASK